ncbi:hypothetical protein C2G38_568041 [Gigaspora rosea]|uniref:Galactose oxidase n=1 Tax=Gigaspora rosea TaxID=44941 RepID=A0A397W104_9GLOM|nr:hypothetical protein C2G38_568041 [Gigaspora rosea]
MRLFRFVLFTFLLSSHLHFLVTCLNVPSIRFGQTSALVGTKLYFFGGSFSTTNATLNPGLSYSNEVWYLDLSNSSLFNTAIPTWYKDAEMPVANFFDTSCVSPTNNSAIFIFGGRQFLPNSSTISFNSPVYKFDPNNNSIWSIPNITRFNSTFITRNLIQAVIDNTGRVFIFGGTSFKVNNNDTSPVMHYNDMNILDLTNMAWSTLVIPQAPPCYSYTATLLPTGLIVYVGGLDYFSDASQVNMSEIRTFNTISFIWSSKVCI